MPGPTLTARLAGASFFAGPAISSEVRNVLSKLVGRDVHPVAPHSRPTSRYGSVVFVGASLPDGWTPNQLLWCHSTHAGIDRLLNQGEWDKGVLLTRTVGAMGQRIAEFVVAWMLAEYQQVGTFLQQHAQRQWGQRPVRWLNGERALVFGTGHVGSEVARLLRCIGLRAVGVSRTARGADSFDVVVGAEDAMSQLGQARWLISTLPLTRATRGYFNTEFFQRCEDACFVNVGRGATVDLAALRAALVDGRLRRAVLDVLPSEPPGPDDPHWDLPNTVVTPHVAGPTRDDDIINDFRQSWEALRSGRRPPLAVDLHQGY